MAVSLAFIPVFFIFSLLLLLVTIPAGLLWRAIRSSRESDERLRRLAERMREKFGEVKPRRPFFGSPRIAFKVDGREAHLEITDSRRMKVRVEESPGVPLPVIIRSRGWSMWPAGGSLQRVSMGDAVIDDSTEIYAGATFAGFLSDRFLDGLGGETSRSELGDSLIVLQNLSGVKSFEFRFAPDSGAGADLKLKTEDMFYRVDELESMLHHLHALHERFAKYDQWEPNQAEASKEAKPGKQDPPA
ncbi:MAG TPA: hypothetical protein VJU16_05290 [Planctomycetota bacterium]|nr:hypothetical protein [Planctomycetota bacterium]